MEQVTPEPPTPPIGFLATSFSSVGDEGDDTGSMDKYALERQLDEKDEIDKYERESPA
jgi:hypothetical protein